MLLNGLQLQAIAVAELARQYGFRELERFAGAHRAAFGCKFFQICIVERNIRGLGCDSGELRPVRTNPFGDGAMNEWSDVNARQELP